LRFKRANNAKLQDDYYGQAFGTAANWSLNDQPDSHHLEVYFNPMSGYPSFQANIDVESSDGSSLYVAIVSGSALSSVIPLVSGQQNTGVQQINGQGLSYCNFLQQSQFNQISESDYVAKLESLLTAAQYVYFFGQVYSDDNGNNGIHDIHRITIDGYGDGGLIVQTAAGNYFGVFAYFDDQTIC